MLNLSCMYIYFFWVVFTLTTLGNAIEDIGAAAIATALDQNSTLCTLDLSCTCLFYQCFFSIADISIVNEITNNGVAAIAQALTRNSKLQSLDLTCTRCICFIITSFGLCLFRESYWRLRSECSCDRFDQKLDSAYDASHLYVIF